jgi:hypothetical protein
MRTRIAAISLLAAAGIGGATAASGTAATKAKNSVFNVKLLGKNEVPKGAPNGSASAKIRLLGTTGKVCWAFTKLKGFTSPSAAHIHKGKKGTAGPIVVPFGSAFKRSGCVTTPAATIAAIQKSPTSYYVNIHNAKYPNGAVRGQL